MEYKIINVNELIEFERRDIRSDVIEKLKERITVGYNPARPLTVIIKDGKNLVADGNHRLTVLRDLGIESVPCVIREGNEYTIAIECNNDEETYAPEDLFDRLDTISQLKEQGLTQSEIGVIVGMSRESIKHHNTIIDKIGTEILLLCKTHQMGRVPINGTVVPFNFSEGWFRNSGLYDLCDKYQERLLNEFIDDKCNWKTDKIKSTAEKYKLWQEMIAIAEEELQDEDLLDDLVELRYALKRVPWRVLKIVNLFHLVIY